MLELPKAGFNQNGGKFGLNEMSMHLRVFLSTFIPPLFTEDAAVKISNAATLDEKEVATMEMCRSWIFKDMYLSTRRSGKREPKDLQEKGTFVPSNYSDRWRQLCKCS